MRLFAAVAGRCEGGRVKALLFCVTCLAVLLSCGAGTGEAAPSHALPSCRDVAGNFDVHVDRNLVVNQHGQAVIFYGISSFGGLMYGGVGADWNDEMRSTLTQIEAARAWHANTVRIQVAESYLFSDPTPGYDVNVPFLRDLCTLVQAVRRQNMAVVINDQDEFVNWNEDDPTEQTARFWQIIAPIYKNQPGVIFDLFNEPHLYHPNDDTEAPLDSGWIWRAWQRGATVDGVRYLGMQAIVDDVRRTGARNIIFLEGPYYSDVLADAMRYRIAGSNIVYDIHHQLLSVGQRGWEANFGYLTAHYPVVDGEWSQYAANRPECQSDAYKMVPPFLVFLRKHGIGLIAWSLQQGALVVDADHKQPSNVTMSYTTLNPKVLEHPDRMYPNYSCTTRDLGEGAGRLLYNYFTRYGSS